MTKPLLRRLPHALAIVIGLLGVAAPGPGGKDEKEAGTPFYRKYLVAGDPLERQWGAPGEQAEDDEDAEDDGAPP